MNISVKFEAGNTIASGYAGWQYDYGKTLEIHGLPELPMATPVHFAADGSTSAEIRTGTYSAGVLIVAIPDVLFESPSGFCTYVYVTTETSGQTVFGIRFYVTARQKPDGAITPEQQSGFDDLVSQLNTLIATVNDVNNEASQSAADAAEIATDLTGVLTSEEARKAAETARIEAEAQRAVSSSVQFLKDVHKAKMDDEIELNKLQYNYARDDLYTGSNKHNGNNYGVGFVSHPSCLAAVSISGEFGETQIGLCKIFEKGNKSGNNGCMIVEGMEVGFPYLNKLRDSNPVTGRWLTVEGYPIPIYITTQDAPNYEKTAGKMKIFAWNGVIYVVINTQRQLNGIKINGHIVPTEGSNISNAAVETVGGHDLVSIKENNSTHYFVCGCSPIQAIAIKANSAIPVDQVLTTDKTAFGESSAYFCLGDNTNVLGSGEIVYCFATDFTKEAAQTNVAAALNGDWHEAFESCKAYWFNIFNGLREKWINVPAKARVKGYLAIGQLMQNCYRSAEMDGLWLGSGAGVWYGNFIRDTSFSIRALSASVPSIAGELLDFFATCNTIYENNCFTIDGVGGSGHNTDNAPTFLMAVGEYYKHTLDTTRIRALQTQINNAMKYLEAEYGNNWKPADGHILALHPHDFGDDGDNVFVQADTKYESMVDILWIAGLEAIKPVFAALEDNVRAEYCDTISTSLREHLSDFIVTSGEYAGMMAHSIKTDGTLATQGMWASTFIYGAWLLGRTDNFKWCQKSMSCLSVKGTAIQYCLALSNLVGAESLFYGWGPFYGLISLIAYKNGDMQPMSDVLDYFPCGTFPEWVQQLGTTDGQASSYTHAPNFPWSYSAIIELINGLAE